MVPKKSDDPAERSLRVMKLLAEKVGRAPAQTFLYVAQHEGLAQTDIAKAIGLSQPSVAKHLSILGSVPYRWSANGKMEVRKGLGLIDVKLEEVTFDVRKPYFLTDKGRKLLAGVDAALDD